MHPAEVVGNVSRNREASVPGHLLASAHVDIRWKRSASSESFDELSSRTVYALCQRTVNAQREPGRTLNDCRDLNFLPRSTMGSPPSDRGPHGLRPPQAAWRLIRCGPASHVRPSQVWPAAMEFPAGALRIGQFRL